MFVNNYLGPFKCYVTQLGVGGVRFSRKKSYEEKFNVISVTRGWVVVQYPEKKRYVTLEWPLPYAHPSRKGTVRYAYS